MTTIFERVHDALESITPATPFAMDVFLSQNDNLPDTFLVYSLIDSIPEQHADNEEKERVYQVQVSIFSRGGLVSLPDADTAMLAAGFLKGPERSLPYDEKTRHFGLAMDYQYM